MEYVTRRYTRTVSGKQRTDMQCLVPCSNPECNQVRWVWAWDTDQQLCQICACRKAGQASWKSLVDKHGYAGAAEVLARRQRKHPSSLESVVMNWLTAWDIPFVFQAVQWFDHPDTNERKFAILDFSIGDGKAIQVDGPVHRLFKDVKARDCVVNRAFPDLLRVSDLDIFQDEESTMEKIREYANGL